MLEIWRPVVGYEGRYEVSNMGRVRSLDRVLTNRVMKGRVLTGGTTSAGHKYVRLCGENEQKKIYVHRIVAEAFIPNENDFPIVDHIDGDPSNNRADNLRWASYSQNIVNRPEYRALLSRIEKLEAEVKRCHELLQLQT